jgi:hypothetical protein
MILGMSLSTFTAVHVMISLVGISAGFAVIFGMMKSKTVNGLTAVFLLTTVLTGVTGFGFPFHQLSPAHKVGMISLVFLAIAILARYSYRMVGKWRSIFVVTAIIAQYLNFFVLVVQAFEKVPSLNAMAPTQKEPPFLVAQLAVLAIFILLTIFAIRKFHPAAAVKLRP